MQEEKSEFVNEVSRTRAPKTAYWETYSLFHITETLVKDEQCKQREKVFEI